MPSSQRLLSAYFSRPGDSSSPPAALPSPVPSLPPPSKKRRRLVPNASLPSPAPPVGADALNFDALVRGAPSPSPSALPSSASARQNPPVLTHLERQVVDVRERHGEDILLMVEVGYRYRFFGEDATTASRVLGIASYLDHSFMTASVPTHRLGVHARRLVDAGHKVGVVRQEEVDLEPGVGSSTRKKVFRRFLRGVYTRSTLLSEDALLSPPPSSLSCFLLCVFRTRHLLGVVAVDLSSSRVVYDEFEDDESGWALETRLEHLRPVEMLLPPDSVLGSHAERVLSLAWRGLLYSSFPPSARTRVERLPLDAFSESADSGGEIPPGLGPAASRALGAVSRYLSSFPNLGPRPLDPTRVEFKGFGSSRCLELDGATVRDLELLQPSSSSSSSSSSSFKQSSADGVHRGSVFWAIDRTRTVFGRRRLRKWLLRPLTSPEEIRSRQDAVSELCESVEGDGSHPLQGVLDVLGWPRRSDSRIHAPVPDLERALSRLHLGAVRPASLLSTLRSFLLVARALPEGRGAEGWRSPVLRSIAMAGDSLGSVAIQQLISKRIACFRGDDDRADDPTRALAASAEERLFPEVCDCRAKISSVEGDLAAALLEIRSVLKRPAQTFRSLRAGVSSVVEYLIEIPRSDEDAASRVPPSWSCVSQTQKVVRYHPPVVLRLVAELERAREALSVACARAWKSFVEDTDRELFSPLGALSDALAKLDALRSMSELARQSDWCRPSVPCVGRTIRVRAARHPAVEMIKESSSRASSSCTFVANDFGIGSGAAAPNTQGALGGGTSGSDLRAVILTGPNMGGKSCYVRTAGILVVLAQMGCWVPAASATIGVFERVMTRMGGEDDLVGGKSTFENELVGVGRMLAVDHDVSPSRSSKTLLLLDELGRGTSTYDGMAIATATLEHIVTRTKCLCYFVTHFPVVTELETHYPGLVANGHMGYEVDNEVGREGDGDGMQRIVFLYEFRWGVAGGSYGMNVARLAGVDERVIELASEKAAAAAHRDSERRRQAVRGETTCRSTAEVQGK